MFLLQYTITVFSTVLFTVCFVYLMLCLVVSATSLRARVFESICLRVAVKLSKDFIIANRHVQGCLSKCAVYFMVGIKWQKTHVINRWCRSLCLFVRQQEQQITYFLLFLLHFHCGYCTSWIYLIYTCGKYCIGHT